MVIKKFYNLSDDGKVLFFLGLSERVVSELTLKEDQKLAQNALYTCWEWLEYKNISGDLLYDLLDNEGMSITISLEMADNEAEIMAWNCIIDAVAFTSRKAFEKEGDKYYPEPISLVDDTLVEHFMKCFNTCVEHADSYIEKMFLLIDSSIKRNLRSNIVSEIVK
ncbi:MAG: Imm6 family immunity protein [Bacillota bacterium]